MRTLARLPPLLALAVLAVPPLAPIGCGHPDARRHEDATCPDGCSSCDAQGACTDCQPGQDTCRDEVVVACNADGTLGDPVRRCDTATGEHCGGGRCVGPCEQAAASRSYIGCDYWPTTLLNAQLNPLFDFAVAIANPLHPGDGTEGAAAHVKVVAGDAPCVPDDDPTDAIAITTVPPDDVKTLRLPWVAALAQLGQREQSAQTPAGAYHLCSSLPVTVYQFNPLQFEKAASSCPDDPDPLDGQCRSYTNDASILLPTTVLEKEYLVVARQSFGLYDGEKASFTPGFFAVVATEDQTHVTVTYRGASASGPGLDAHQPGDSATYVLGRGEVLQVASGAPSWDGDDASPACAESDDDGDYAYCDPGPDYDLTGSRIVADKPVAVFGGHSCSFVPYDAWACDHLEEQLFPLDTWGKQVLAAQTPPQNDGEPNVWRVISGGDGNAIVFDPPVADPVTLDAGEYVELVAEGGFQVTGTAGLQVAQYMVGGSYVDPYFSDGTGDPSLGLAVPVEQYRKSYDFITPDTYTRSFVTVIAPTGVGYTLDGQAATLGTLNGQAIGDTGYAFAWVELQPGAHHISADVPFGINVSGLAPYASYLYPGGLNLHEINPQ